MIRRVRSNLRQIVLRQDRQVRKEIFDELVSIGNDWAKHYRKVVANWKGQPRFGVRVSVTPEKIQLYVIPEGEHANKWRWIDEGTGIHGASGQAYKIRPKAPGYPLRFQAAYSARTAPVAQFDVGTGQSSGPTIRTYEVTHPGIEPRKFGEDYAEKIKPEFARNINNAIRRGVRRAN